jgi:hypothetical protein
VGTKTPRSDAARTIASALGVPVAPLFTHEVVRAEVRVSEATIEQVRREGREASRQATERIASRLEPFSVLGTDGRTDSMPVRGGRQDLDLRVMSGAASTW